LLPFGIALVLRRSRRHLRQSPDRDDEGEHPHRYSVHGSHLLAACHGVPGHYQPSIIPPNPFPIRWAFHQDGVHIATHNPWFAPHYAITGLNAAGVDINAGQHLARQEALWACIRGH
jgi:hypothetical protein